MRIFVQGYKVNFVDESGVFVGFSNEDDCCAFGGWYFSRDAVCAKLGPADRFEKDPGDLDGYLFDKDFFQDNSEGCHDGGGEVVVRLIKNNEEDYYLHCFNFHNGYYARGFEFSDGKLFIKEMCI